MDTRIPRTEDDSAASRGDRASPPSITAFFPAFNDEESIGDLVRSVDQLLRELGADYEVLVIDDGSTDNTAQVLDVLALQLSHLRVLHHEQNRGYGGALRSGFAQASKDFVFYTDGDGQYDPRELKLLLSALSHSVDMVQGFKVKRHDPAYRVVIGRLYHHFVKYAFRLKVRDVDCDFRLIRRSIFDRVTLEFDSGVICVELVKKIQAAGFQITEVPVSHRARRHGSSQFFTFSRIFKTARDLTRLWLKTNGVHHAAR